MHRTDSSSQPTANNANGETTPLSTHTPKTGSTENWVRIGLLVFVSLLYLPGLGSFGLWDPWEVHYGEAGRQILERQDWLSPWWGSHWHAPDHAAEGSYFFSKPILQLWAMAFGIQLFGHTALAIRLGTAIIAIIGVMSAYIAGERVWNRRVGLLMALTLATSPFYLMLSRQAQTDMPFVALMSSALFFFLAALFGRDRDKDASKRSWQIFWIAVGAFSLWQMQIVTVALLDWRSDLPIYDAALRYGPLHALLYAAALGWTFVSWLRHGGRSRRVLRLYLFYSLVALATLAKGLLGFLLPGAIILSFILVQRDWRMLQRVELLRGISLTLVIGLPWYAAMIARHGGIGGAFWTRFIVHDHFRRLAAGVHQIDTGSFEHFIRWLGYGLFPWIGLLPVSLTQTFRFPENRSERDTTSARIFLFLWALVAFALFTLSSTKFHHYIFPAVPPLALLAALAIDDLLNRDLKLEFKPMLSVAAIGIIVIIGVDLWADPQNLKNLFTYAYDRPWDGDIWNPQFRPALLAGILLSIVGVIFLFLPFHIRFRQWGLVALVVATVGSGVWTLHRYMPALSHSWSQQGLWDVYYQRCTPMEAPPNAHALKRYCEEPVISYRLNWRGETFYTQNEVVPILDSNDWNYFQEVNAGACFYAMMDHGRLRHFTHAVREDERQSIRKITTSQEYPELQALDPELYERFMRRIGKSNNKFILLQVNCDDSLTTGTTSL